MEKKWETEIVPKILERYSWKTNEMGKSVLGEIDIKLIDNETIFKPYFKRSEAEDERIEKIIDEYEAAGLVEPSESRYSTPIFLKGKPNSTEARVLQDLRAVNE